RLAREQVGRGGDVLLEDETAPRAFVGRTATQAPEIDGHVAGRGSGAPGDVVPARVGAAGGYYLRGAVGPTVNSAAATPSIPPPRYAESIPQEVARGARGHAVALAAERAAGAVRGSRSNQRRGYGHLRSRERRARSRDQPHPHRPRSRQARGDRRGALARR